MIRSLHNYFLESISRQCGKIGGGGKRQLQGDNEERAVLKGKKAVSLPWASRLAILTQV